MWVMESCTKVSGMLSSMSLVAAAFKYGQMAADMMDFGKMVEEMVEEVDKHDQSIQVNEELYNKLEMKVRKKFNEEVDKLEKSFRRVMDQLEIQHQNLFQMMKEQIDKEIKQL